MIEDLLFRHSKNGVLTDTNLMVLLVIGSVSKHLIPITKRTKGFAEEDFDLLVAILGLRRGALLTTPHILAETSNLVTNALSGDYLLSALQVLKELVVTDLEEHYVTGRTAVSDPIFMNLGLTDSGIATLKSIGCLMLTVDGPLYGRLVERGVPALNFNHHRSY